MKKISVLFTIFCFLLVNNIYGQDSENKWQFSFGINAVDLKANSFSKPADLFDVQNNWNGRISIFAFSIILIPILDYF